MNTSKIIKAYIGAGTYSTTESITQGDYGYILQIEGAELPATYRVDFSNNRHEGEALTVYGNENGAEVPKELIDTGKDVYAFYYYIEENFGKTVYTWKIPNDTRAQNGDREPTPTQQDYIDQLIVRSNEAVERAEDAQQAIEDMSVSAQTLAEGESATVTKTEQEGVVHLEFGIPKGATGDTPTITASKTGKTTSIYVDGSEVAQIEDGTDGTNGDDGYSPTANVTKSGKTATITITDKNGTTSAQVEDGTNGTDGISPTVTITPITGGHRITITDADGEHSADVMDGDNYTLTAQDKQDIAELVDVPVDDVQINGTSIVTDGVANIPLTTKNVFGAVAVNDVYGITAVGGTLMTVGSSNALIKAGTNGYRQLNPSNQHLATFYGLAKIAGHDENSSALTAGTYTEEAKIAIQKMLGIYEAPWELIREDTFTNEEEADHIISTDANGEAFELTDIRIIFWLPQQETVASKKDIGRITFEVNSNTKDYAYLGEWTQQAGEALRGGWAEVIQANGMIELHYIRNVSDANVSSNMVAPFRWNNAWNHFVYDPNGRAYNRVIITKVTGTGRYRLYGRRKWQ